MTTLLKPSSERSDSGNAFIREVVEEKRWNRDIRQRFERQWLLNYAFFLGIQHGSWSTLFGMPQFSPSQAGRVKYVANQIKHRVLRRVAQLVSPPGWQVVAKDTDIQHALGAKVGEDLLNHLYESLGLHKEITKMVFYGVTMGSGFCRIRFDSWKGPAKTFYFDPVTTRPIPPETLTQEQREELSRLGFSKRIAEGEITVEGLSPFRVYIPPVGEGEERSWVMVVSLVPKDRIYDDYGSQIGDIVSSSAGAGRKALWLQNLSKLQGAIGPFGGWVVGPDDEDLVWVRELWYRACERFPEGRYIVEANGVTIRDSSNPNLSLGFNFPIVQFNYIDVAERVWGVSMVEDLIWPQKSYNEMHEIRQENLKLMGRPQWLNPKQSGARITNKPGGIIEYDPRHGAPQPVKIPTVDQAVELQAQWSLRDMQDISSQQDVTQAKVPPNIRSGVAIQLLKEGDQEVVSPVVRSLEKTLKDLGQKLLKFVATFWDPGKMIRLWGKDQILDIEPFRELAMKDAFSVVIPTGSMMPRSKAAQAQFALEAAQAGLIDYTNPLTRKKVLEVLELGNLDSMLKDELQDVRRAEMENEIFMVKGPQDGAWPAVESFDNHMIHKMVHDRARKTDMYEYLPMEAKLAFDEHCKIHDEAIQQQLQAQMQMAEAVKGTPGEKGQPSPPKDTGQAV